MESWLGMLGCSLRFPNRAILLAFRLYPSIIHADTLLRQFLEEFLQPLHVGCE